MTVARLPIVFNRGIGVKICFVVYVSAPESVILPDRKFGNRSFVRLRPLGIAPTLLARLRRRLALVGLRPTLALRRRPRLTAFLRNKFFEPLGKNLPFASLGNVLASFLPLATLLADFRLLVLRFGITRKYWQTSAFMPIIPSANKLRDNYHRKFQEKHGSRFKHAGSRSSRPSVKVLLPTYTMRRSGF